MSNRKKMDQKETLNEFEAAEFMNISVSHLRASRLKKPTWAGPSFTKKDGWRIHYELKDLIAFRKIYSRETKKIDPAQVIRSAQGKGGEK